jgi:hypothetical protein
MIMSTLHVTAVRDLTCALGATLITLVLSLTFVHTTSVVPGTPHSAGIPIVELHGWVGQPEPAVLVD